MDGAFCQALGEDMSRPQDLPLRIRILCYITGVRRSCIPTIGMQLRGNTRRRCEIGFRPSESVFHGSARRRRGNTHSGCEITIGIRISRQCSPQARCGCPLRGHVAQVRQKVLSDFSKKFLRREISFRGTPDEGPSLFMPQSGMKIHSSCVLRKQVGALLGALPRHPASPLKRA